MGIKKHPFFLLLLLHFSSLKSLVKIMVAGVAAFCVVDGRGRALYEADFGSTARRDDARHLRQFVVAAALDKLNERKWETPNAYLKIIDHFDHDLVVHAYCTQGGIQFALLTTKGREEGNVKAF